MTRSHIIAAAWIASLLFTALLFVLLNGAGMPGWLRELAGGAK